MLNHIYSEDLFNKFDYTSINWIKKELINYIKEYENNIVILRFLADYLHINIFLLNINEDKIHAIYPEEKFNIFKYTIFLSYYDKVFEPITYKNIMLFNHDLDPIKKLINVDSQFINVSLDGNLNQEITKKIFTIDSEDLDKYLNLNPNSNPKPNSSNQEQDQVDNNIDENIDLEIDEDDENLDENLEINDNEETEIITEPKKNGKDIFCKKEKNKEDKVEAKVVDKEKLKNLDIKMKLVELQDLADLYKINTKNKNKNKTKQELFNELTKLK